ncbi:hypothetical protein D3C79_785270 [compost metagenome]
MRMMLAQALQYTGQSVVRMSPFLARDEVPLVQQRDTAYQAFLERALDSQQQCAQFIKLLARGWKHFHLPTFHELEYVLLHFLHLDKIGGDGLSIGNVHLRLPHTHQSTH